jgi:uncharacterized protein (TIGR03382 family)
MHGRTLTALAVVSTLGAAASADVFEYNFFLSGDQEVPPADTHAVGAAQLLYNSDTQTFSLDVMVFGIGLDDLLGVGPNSTPIHIHNAPAGSNGPIVIDLGFIDSFFEDGQGIRFSVTDQPFGGTYGDIVSDPDVNQAELFARNLYVNIHTESFPSGELRGQIIPSPASLALLGLGGLAATRRRRA